jgi:ectoine hydroxylase-related dioxygenase (phytanoyl-CoA dioxygenase family)
VVGPQSAQEAPAPAQVYHRDDSMWAGDWIANLACGSAKNEELPNLSVSVMWAVSDFTNNNGATQLALRSHRQCPRTTEPPSDMIFHKAIMKKGSVVLWLGGTFHGASSCRPLVGGADAPPRAPRRGLLHIYNLGFLRSEHNFYNAIPRDVMAKFDEPLRDLLGYHGDNPVEHRWYTGPVYSQPYLGFPLHGNAAGGEGVQYAVEPESVWDVSEPGEAVLL